MLRAGTKVVINEVHYHPGDDTRGGEFVELHNFDSAAADLSGWILLGGVNFSFPSGTAIPADSYLVIAADPAVIRSRYGLGAQVVLGPYDGTLSNDSDRLELWTAEGYLMSFIGYEDSEPWPETPDGLGPSLERVSPLREEHDAEAWAASIVVGGSPGALNSARIEDPLPPPGDSQLIAPGAQWRFFRGRSEPPGNWEAIGFNEAAWETGTAGIGYADGDDATVLNDMRNQYTTVYARRAFAVANPALVESLSLSVIYDDAYVAYLNGVEVDRANAPGAAGTPMPYDALAVSNVQLAQLRTADISSRRNLLVAGTNVLAVQGVNITIGSRDFSLHPSLVGRISQGQTTPVTYVEAGEDWRFFRGTADPPGAWRNVSFVDDGWELGPSGLGYGDGDDATELLDMENGYLAVFARRRFQVTDAALVASLTLSVDFDDGFIAYLNGVEVARMNLDSAGASSPANSTHEAGTPEELPIPAPASILRTGVNVLAIQGHNNTVDSTDLSLIPALHGSVSTGEGGPGPDPPPARPARDVVLNEVLIDAGGAGWVELFNTTASAVAVGGRRLSLYPSTSGSFVLPPASIPGRGRAVFNESALGFALATAPVLMFTTGDHKYIDALNPRTTPAGMATGRWPDGSDNRFVFSAPTRNAANTITLDGRIVINEIQYHPGDANTGGEFIELHNRGTGSINVGGWSFTRGVEYTIPSGTSIPAGGYLVIARDPVAAGAFYGISQPLGPYTGNLANDAETILLRDALKNTVDRVRYADDGSWPGEADGTGPSVELANPALENRYGLAWRASTGDGTPGAPNSARETDPPPIIAGVEHSPVIPAPADTVLVTAAVSDERPITSATLFWRNDGGGGAGQTAMVDDGVGDDGIAGNGVHGARVPARPDRTIVQFWIQAAAPGGQTVTAPRNAPSPAFLYQVEQPGAASRRPVYRIVMTASDLQDLRSRGNNSDVLLDCTLVSKDKPRYNRGIRYRGSSARSCDPISYRVQFDHDADLDGMKDLNLNGCNTQRQWIGLDFLARTGLATPESWFRTLSINGAVASDLYLRVESIEEPFLERVFPAADEGGNLYRGVDQANLDYRGESFAPYTGDYEKHSNEEAADWSDVTDLCFRFDAGTTSAAEFPAAVEAAVDIDEWALFFAAFAVLASTENSILLNNGDDYFLYHRPSDDRWVLLPWDLDSVFDEGQQELFRPTVNQIERFLEHPRYAPLYWCHLEQLLAGAFVREQVDARLDHLAPLFSPGRISQLRQFVPERISYITARLSPALTVNVTSGASLCGDALLLASNPVAFDGRAPGCGTTEVRVNATPAAYDPLTASWSATLPVNPGPVSVVALDRNGAVVARRDLTTGTSGSGTPLTGTITTSRTLVKGQSPYRASANVTIQVGVTLTIDPGVTLILDGGATIVVDGDLIAAGTSSEPVNIQGTACGGSTEGITFRGSGPGSRLTHCKVTNLAGAQGFTAGVVVDGPTVEFANVEVSGPSGGRSVEVRSGGTLTVESSLFHDSGIGLVFAGSSGIVDGCEFRDLSGTAIRVSSSSGVLTRGCLLRRSGTAVDVTGNATLTADHLTIHACGTGLDLREESPGAGPGIVVAHSLIVWSTGTAVAEDGGAPASITYSDLAGIGARPGTGNISADPRFRDTAAGDFRLLTSSPCRATGKDGTDMGAFPYEPTGETRAFLRCDSNADGVNDIADAIRTVFALFAGGAQSTCAAAADCNGDGSLNLTDVIFDLSHLFRGGSKPPGPYPTCDRAPIESCAATTCVGG